MMRSGTISVFIGMLPAMKTTEPYSPGPRERQRKPGQQRRRDGGKNDPRERLPAPGTETGRGFLDLDLQIIQHRLHRPDHERQADEDQRDGNAEPGIGDLDSERLEVCSHPPARGVQAS